MYRNGSFLLHGPMNSLRPSVLLLVLLVLAGCCLGQTPSLQDSLTAAVGGSEKELSAVIGMAVTDLRSGKTLADHRGGELFIPASNQKLLTSSFAMARLGAAFEFTTTLYYAGGNLVIVGDGDPTLGDARVAAAAGKTIYDDLDAWSLAVKARMGDSFAGDIVVCDPQGPQRYRNPDWPAGQSDQWYVAAVATLNFNNNCLDITLGLDGDKVVPAIAPQSRLITTINNITKGRRQSWSARLGKDDSEMTLRGTIVRATTEPENVAVNDPPLLLGRVLAERLVRAGVSFTGQVRRAEPAAVDLAGAQVIGRKTTPLGTAMTRANKRSLNMAAECIFLRAGDGTWAGSAEKMTQTLIETFGLSGGELTVHDGGGLSRNNRIAPAAMVKLLAAMSRRPDAAVFLSSLPISGVDGTMEKRLDKPPYRGRVLGKTGYITAVSSLSGYVLDESGKPVVAFSILANKVPDGKGWKVKQLQDHICQLLVDAVE